MVTGLATTFREHQQEGTTIQQRTGRPDRLPVSASPSDGERPECSQQPRKRPYLEQALLGERTKATPREGGKQEGVEV